MKRKKIHASFSIAPQTAKLKATVYNKCLVKIEKALNLCSIVFGREDDHIHVNVITAQLTLSNMSLNCVGPLIHGVLNSKSYST